MLFIHVEPAALLQLLVSTVFPLLVALVTKRDTHPARRAVLLALLAVATSFAAQLANALQAHAPFDLVAALIAALVSFLIAVGMHFGLWSPTGAAVVLQGVGFGQNTTPDTANPQAAAGGLGSASYVAPRVVQPAIPGTVLPDLATAPAVTAADPGTFAPVDTAYFTPPAVPAVTDPADSFKDPARPAAS